MSSAVKPPTPAQIQTARDRAKLTQAQSAALVHSTARRWREWESGDHRMSAAVWELYKIKTTAVIFVDSDQPKEQPK
jgi:DNA-binding transcriptional regulator YiaG